ncbi:MAG: hypothetical protein HY329_11780 [Chloroflexi bacterium]|nr:hypothetical protein [Chloroflexota bacterium]
MLVILVDAADEALTRRLLDQGELPNLAKLLGQGTWGQISSPADRFLHLASGCRAAGAPGRYGTGTRLAPPAQLRAGYHVSAATDALT